MSRPAGPLLALLAAAALLWPASTSAQSAPTAPPAGVGFTYVDASGHNLGFGFKRFYEANGGLAQFGLPLTDPLAEDGLRVQYFERARFELHPGGGVALTRVGSLLAEGRAEPPFQWLGTNPNNGRSYIAQSGHTLGGAFEAFWNTRGGVALFGYPVSEEFVETGADGAPRLVQYFERARFELAQAPDGSATVQLGLVGRELLDRRPDIQGARAPAPRMQLLGRATTSFRTSGADRRINVERAASMFDGAVVEAGQEHSFLAGGDFSDSAGFVEGYGIVGGKLEKVIGGGLCQVSTTLFRAVSNAGMEITRRVGHSYVVYFYENILGFDATVFSPSVDFRWRNDMGSAVTLAAITDLGAATVTFEVWGYEAPRAVTYQGPATRNVVQPGRAMWQYDPTMAPGATRQLVHGRAGMDVTLGRTVTAADGTPLRQDRFVTHYKPWNDYDLYGPGVVPPAGVQIVPAPRARP